MNPIHAIRHLACILAGLAAAALALTIAAAPAALATIPLPPGGGPAAPAIPRPLPPGWYKHPPPVLPALAHAAVSGMPGWQIGLIAAGAALLAVTLALLLYRALAARRRTAPGPA